MAWRRVELEIIYANILNIFNIKKKQQRQQQHQPNQWWCFVIMRHNITYVHI